MPTTKPEAVSVADFLKGAGLGDLTERFVAQDIDLEMLPELSDDDLKELGLSLGQRKKFRKALNPAQEAPAARPASIPAERRQLTVAFCDLVGSTSLATQLDPEDLRKVIAEYLETVIGTMEAHGGHLAYTQGDGVMVYFGYPIAQEDDAANAVRAAIASISAVQSITSRAPSPLNARIGVATGLVVVGDIVAEALTPQDFVVGETPNLAARLQNLAEPGEIIVSAETRELAGGLFDYQARGDVELKGFAKPRPVFRVVSENTSKSRFDARSTDNLQPIIGRDAELAELNRLWQEVQKGQGRLASIKGPPGIGKSRISRSLARKAGPGLIQLQCVSRLANRALHPLTQELEHAAGIDRNWPDEKKAEKLAALVVDAPLLTEEDLPYLADVLGIHAAERLTGSDPILRARHVRDAMIRRFVGMVEGGHPLLILLEDAHWADSATREFLAELVERITDEPIMVVVTHRHEYSVPPELLAHGTELDLSALDHTAAMALIQKVVGERSLPAVLMRKIAEKTDGVPLFIEELTKTILERLPSTGPITADTLEHLTIPATLQDSLMSRLDRMGPAKEIAQLASVIGRGFNAAMVEAVAPNSAAVAEALKRLSDAELIAPDAELGANGYSFNHALIQDTAYKSMLRSRRHEVHLAVAQAILEGNPAFGVQEPEIVARHCDQGGLTQEAITHWMAAGRHAVEQAANLPAITYMEAALRLLETLPEDETRDRTELAIQMALAPAYMAIYGWAAKEVEQSTQRASMLAQKLGDGQSLFGATWGLWTNYFLRGELENALQVAMALKAMADAVPPGVATVAAAHAVSYTHYFRGELKEAQAALEAGLAHQSFEMDQAMLPTFQLGSGTALHAIGSNIHWHLGQTEEAYAIRERGIEQAVNLKHPPTIVQCTAVSTIFLLAARDWPLLIEAMNYANRISDEENFLYFKPMHEIFLGLADASAGKLDEALPKVEYLISMVKSTGAKLTLIGQEVVACEILVDAGRAEEALERMSEFGPDAYERHERVFWPEFLRVRGMAHEKTGQLEKARADYTEALETARSAGQAQFIARAEACLSRLQDSAGNQSNRSRAGG